MNSLKEFLKEHKFKPTPWAVKNNISPSVISRVLNGGGVSLKNAVKIEIASGHKVMALDLLKGLGREKAV